MMDFISCARGPEAAQRGWRPPPRALRMTGRVGERRATSQTPARRKADVRPVQANTAGIMASRGSTG